MFRAKEIKNVIQDLIYARKASTKTVDSRIVDEINFDAEKIYFETLIGILTKLMIKEMYDEVFKR